jgi:hypothetical protein
MVISIRISVIFLPLLRLLFISSSLLLACIHGIAYKECGGTISSNTNNERRILHIATCDTRHGWKEFKALQPWNITGQKLKLDGVATMSNVCKGGHWGVLGFLTKPLTYLAHIRRIIAEGNPNDVQLMHIVLMDSDTFWAVDKLSDVWQHYDCARQGANAVMSTEMSCWMGRYCNDEDIAKWYQTLSTTPSYSPFANSGVIMGQISSVAKLLQFVVDNNASYWTTYGKKFKFDDQYAYADYTIRVFPGEIALDYHQQIAGSFSMHMSPIPIDEGWPFICKNSTGGYNSCPDKTKMLTRRYNYFRLNTTSCLIHREVDEGTPFREELLTLAPDPLIWHGNGAGKEAFRDKSYSSMKCFLDQRKMSIQQYDELMYSER